MFCDSTFLPATAARSHYSYFLQIPDYVDDMLLSGKLSEKAAVAYARMISRLNLSKQNAKRWSDRDGHVYIIYSRDEIERDFRCSESTAKNILKELRGANLIHTEAKGRFNRIYINELGCVKPEEEEGLAHPTESVDYTPAGTEHTSGTISSVETRQIESIQIINEILYDTAEHPAKEAADDAMENLLLEEDRHEKKVSCSFTGDKNLPLKNKEKTYRKNIDFKNKELRGAKNRPPCEPSRQESKQTELQQASLDGALNGDFVINRAKIKMSNGFKSQMECANNNDYDRLIAFVNCCAYLATYAPDDNLRRRCLKPTEEDIQTLLEQMHFSEMVSGEQKNINADMLLRSKNTQIIKQYYAGNQCVI